jgi:CBS domain-containing protein
LVPNTRLTNGRRNRKGTGMPENENFHAVPHEVVIDFLRTTLPFRELNDESLTRLVRRSQIAFYSKGTIILEQDVQDVPYLYVIQKGGVQLYRIAEDRSVTLADFRGDGASFGGLAIMRNIKAHLTVEAIEDTFCFLLDKDAFQDLIKADPIFAESYYGGFSEDLVCRAYSELRCEKVGVRTEDAFYLFGSQISEAIVGPPEFINTGDSIHSAAARMEDRDVGSLLVQDQANTIVGIVTDRDLRSKVVARRLDYDLPITTIMSAPVATISSNALCFDAVLRMMDRRVEHLVVARNEEIIGVVTARDLLAVQGSSPLDLLREVSVQRTPEGIGTLSGKVTPLVRELIEGGAKADHITKIISLVNDRIVEQLLSLVEKKLGPPPVPFCWIVMGSEGRKEQTFKTDQDNALLYEDPGEVWDEVKRAKVYFRHFGNEAVEYLEASGYPKCKGRLMASEPKWRKPRSTWTDYFDGWMSASEPEETLNAKIFFDFRPCYGDKALAGVLRSHVIEEAQRRTYFINHLSKDCLTIQPPLSFFRSFIVEKNGEHKNRLNLKMRGLVPVVDFARMMALKHGITETNTLSRLQLLGEAGHIPADLCGEIGQAYEFLMHLRLVHQLKLIEDGKEPNNHLDPASLSDLEKRILKEAFGVVNRMQVFVAKMRAMI